MRVLFHLGASEWAGGTRAFADAARLLAARGYTVIVTCPPGSLVEQRLGSPDGVEIVPLVAVGSWVDESSRLRQVVRDEHTEVVFVHTAREHLAAAAALRLADRGAVVRRVPVGAPLPLGGPTERAAAILAASGFLFASHNDLQVISPPRRPFPPVVAPLGVGVAAYQAVRPSPRAALGVGPDERLVVCVTDAASRAGVATVLRAVSLLSDRHPELRLAIIGPGADHEDLRMHAAALGIMGIVGFLGERDDRLAVLRAADIGWVVAEHDSAAYGFLDFMALEVPVVAERTATSAHYVADGITGMLLPPGDAPGAAAAVATLLARAEVREAMGRAAQVRAARDFDETAMAQGFITAAAAARDRSRWRQ